MEGVEETQLSSGQNNGERQGRNTLEIEGEENGLNTTFTKMKVRKKNESNKGANEGRMKKANTQCIKQGNEQRNKRGANS